MYSQKLKKYIEDHRPEPFYFSDDDVCILASKAGFVAYKSDDEGNPLFPITPGDVLVVKWGEPMAWQRQRPFEYVCVRNASIAWEARLTDDRLTYSPILQYESVALGSQAPSGLVDLKLRQVDSVPIVYEMVGLVRMMRPSWCGHAPVFTCFREEAETLAMDYVFKLAGEFGYDVELKKR